MIMMFWFEKKIAQKMSDWSKNMQKCQNVKFLVHSQYHFDQLQKFRSVDQSHKIGREIIRQRECQERPSRRSESKK